MSTCPVRPDRVAFEDALFPAQAFFNALHSAAFIRALEAFSNGIGSAYNDLYCHLPRSIAEDEHVPVESIDYAEFWVYGVDPPEVRVSIPRFLELLREAAAAEARMRPERAERIAALVEATARTLNSPGRAPPPDGKA